MKYLDFYKKFSHWPLVDLRDVEAVFSGFDRRRITEWKEKGYILKITNNFYTPSEYVQNEGELFFIANKLHNPSYVSLESALSFYGLIPEGVFDVTSVTSLKTRRIYAGLSMRHLDFLYLKIKKELFFGYKVVKTESKKTSFLIAEPEKAILDSLYLITSLRKEEDFKEMRFNREKLLPLLGSKKMKAYLKVFNSNFLNKKIDILTKIYA